MGQEHIEELLKLKQLFEKGIITKEELEAEKAKLLNGNSLRTENNIPQKGASKQAETTQIKTYAMIGVIAALLIIVVVGVFVFKGRTSSSPFAEAYKGCIELDDINIVNPAMDGKLVYATGLATTNEYLRDDYFDISVNALNLIRNVQYYQWVEHSKTETYDKNGGGQETITTYTYDKQWVSSPLNSDIFKDPGYRGCNSVLETVHNETWLAKRITLGAYTLPDGLVSQIRNRERLDIEKLLRFSTITSLNNRLATHGAKVHIKGNTIYFGADPTNPRIGDIKVSFEYTPSHSISLVAVTDGDSFTEYMTENGTTLFKLVDGEKSMKEMLGR